MDLGGGCNLLGFFEICLISSFYCFSVFHVLHLMMSSDLEFLFWTSHQVQIAAILNFFVVVLLAKICLLGANI